MRGNKNTKHWETVAQNLYRNTVQKAHFDEIESRRSEAVHHTGHDAPHGKKAAFQSKAQPKRAKPTRASAKRTPAQRAKGANPRSPNQNRKPRSK
jgi:hypothetical protein